MSKFTDKLKELGIDDHYVTNPKKREMLWRGPQVDGITYSLLSRFMVCPERFFWLVYQGLKPTPKFNHRMEYGNLWHTCEEHAHKGEKAWKSELKKYSDSLLSTYPLDREQIRKWTTLCALQFPHYLKYWDQQSEFESKNKKEEREVVIGTELEFNVRYPTTFLPGESVRLRGKLDKVFTHQGMCWHQENKTKSSIDEFELQTRLTCDMQSMIYLIALYLSDIIKEDQETAGVRYNVVRRPLSGGKGTIRQKQPTKSNPSGESLEDYYDRVESYFDNYPEEFFMRWDVIVTKQEGLAFAQKVLTPVLTRLTNWYRWVKHCVTIGDVELRWLAPGGIHYQHPYGIYNPLLEGGASDLDNLINTGSEVGLSRTDTLFPELSQ